MPTTPEFDANFLNEPRGNSPIGAGDNSIRRFKSSFVDIMSREHLGFGAELEPGKQGYMRTGSAKLWVWDGALEPTQRPNGTNLSEDDVGRTLSWLPRAGQGFRTMVYVKIGDDLGWVPVPEGNVGEIRSHAGGWVDPTTSGTDLDFLKTGTKPGWFKADGRELTLPARFGGTVTLPNLIDVYPKFGATAASEPAGEHTRTLDESYLPGHVHTLDQYTGTPSQWNALTVLGRAGKFIGRVLGVRALAQDGLTPADESGTTSKHDGEDYGSQAFSGRRGVNSNGRGESGVVSTLTIGQHSHGFNLSGEVGRAGVGNSATNVDYPELNVEPEHFVLVPIYRVY